MVSFVVQKLLHLIRSHLFIFCFYFHYSRSCIKKDLSENFVNDLPMIFSCLIHFEFIYSTIFNSQDMEAT